ncbi:MAG: ABC transporter permease [Clostridia bacterium]|nr:ABC transporter permease [Clostridia bacterium]
MESILMAFKAIRSNKMRSFLTMLGIIIGVLSIVVLTAIGQGTNAEIIKNIEGMGTNLLSVTVRARRNNPVTLDSIQKMASSSDSVAYAAPILTSSGTVKANLIQYEDGSLIATTPGYEKIRGWTLRYGRFITNPDVDNRSFVAVLGQEASVELFGTVNSVGQTFTYKGYTFEVVGVLNEIGSTVIGSGDNLIIFPFTLGERLFNSRGISSFYVSATSADVIDDTQATVKNYMDRLISASTSSTTYTINNQSAMLEALNKSTRQLTLMLAGIAAISLLVGGIGIMNIMLVSVSERTREIGIRKAIGATRANILSQFLVEALTVSLLGGMIGLALSWFVCEFLQPVIGMTMVFSPSVALLAIGFSVGIGVIFGLYPANKASKLRPIEALRYE